MRKFAFDAAYWALSFTYGLLAALSVLIPGRGLTLFFIRRYVRRMVQAMGAFAGIHIVVQGREHLPQGAFIVASKHQSWGDGFATYNQFDDLAFVTGDHLEKLPLLAPILHKLGAIVVDSCGGPEARKALSESAAAAHADGRRILIFPEGHLAKAGERFKYRSGVFYMYRDFDLPVVPVATNLGLRWPQQDAIKHPGVATVEFLDPIPTGLSRGEFLKRLETAVESRTQELIAMATGEPVTDSVLVSTPSDVAKAKDAASA